MPASKFALFASEGFSPSFSVLTDYLEPDAIKIFSLAVLGGCATVLSVMGLVGCTNTSPGLPNIYIAALRLRNAANNFEMRVSYYGVCASQNQKLDCFGTTRRKAQSSGVAAGIAESFDSTASMDSLIASAFALQSVLDHTFAAGGVAYLLGCFCCLPRLFFLKDVKWVKMTSIAAASFFGLAVALLLVSLVSLRQTLAVLQFATSKVLDSPLQASRGSTLERLLWVSLIFLALFSIGASAMLFRGPPTPPPKPGAPAPTTPPAPRQATSTTSSATARAPPTRTPPGRAVQSRQQ